MPRAAKKAAKAVKAANILVIDDDLPDLRAMKVALEADGYSVFASSNGRQALEIVGKVKFAAILIDIRMPEISGYELLRLLKERMNGGPRIIFVSIVPKADVDMGGADGFVQKPFSAKGISFEVRRVLG